MLGVFRPSRHVGHLVGRDQVSAILDDKAETSIIEHFRAWNGLLSAVLQGDDIDDSSRQNPMVARFALRNWRR
jgi:hypothetical protein